MEENKKQRGNPNLGKKNLETSQSDSIEPIVKSDLISNDSIKTIMDIVRENAMYEFHLNEMHGVTCRCAPTKHYGLTYDEIIEKVLNK